MSRHGRTALVVGGRGGIGRAIVARFLTEGATVYAADLSPDGSEGGSDGSRFLCMDVTSPEQVAAGFDRVRRAAGRLNVLVNAAGWRSRRLSRTPRWRSGTAASRST